jgi:ubiquinone/menaquinone biosynthesis C-methylase UbiE
MHDHGFCTSTFLIFCLEHYKTLAPQYDKFFEAERRAKANFTPRFIPLSKDDQIVDIGGGTAHISLKIHSDLGMTNPVVCVDPSRDMLNVAQKNGAIAIQATAEEFLASKPEYPLKVVLMNGCVHHFTDVDFVFTKLAEYMPDDGVCFVTEYSGALSLPFFKAAVEAHTGIGEGLDQLQNLIKSIEGLKCREVLCTEPGQTDKRLWYDAIRSRFFSLLMRFSDEQLEQGIEELEEQFKGQDTLTYDMTYKGLIVTKI